MRPPSSEQPQRERALVTGASRGLGWKFAKLLALRGYDLVITARDRSRLDAFRAKYFGTGVDIRVFPADLSSPREVDRLVDALKKQKLSIDLLINNAGFGAYGPFLSGELARQQEMVAVNVAALIRLTRLLVPEMVARGHGGVLNIASMAGFVPGPFMAIYYATKAFVVSFSQALGRELAGTGVTVTALCPGYVETDFAATAGFSSGAGTASLDAETVAAAGIRALLAGKPIEVPGLANRILAFAARLAPRRMLTDYLYRFNARR